MKVSILIANYNNGKYFQDCYNSIMNQTYEDWEMIIVDDGSTDNSVFEIKKIIQGNPKVKFFQNLNNEGCGYTKEGAVKASRGELCTFVDPDDTLEPHALETLVNVFKENPQIGLAYSRFRNVDENLIEISVYDNPKIAPDDRIDFLNMNGEISHLAMFKRALYNKTKGIDPFLKRAVDQDLYLKLYEVSETWFVDEILYNYRRINKGISTGENAVKAYFWRWVVNIDAAKRRNINLEDLFIEKINERFVEPKQKMLEKSWTYPLFRLEWKIRKLLNAK